MAKIKNVVCGCAIILFCMGLPFVLWPQVIITVQLPAGGLVQKEQLWNLSLVNNNEPLDVNIKLTLQDAFTGQEVLSAFSGNITLNKGIKILSNTGVQPVVYNYPTGFSGSFLPVGTYNACYQVNSMRSDLREPVSNGCMRLTVDPLSPPLLSFPGDKSKLNTPYPMFAWMPPAPVNMFT
ncbi:MAG: hypothetical protein ABIS01_00730, partial [Ferruginibacter sp.]